jgi:SAM-dependent methyltransferase
MVRVAGTADADWFLRSGRAAYDAIAAKVPPAEAAAVLDFGCGCGRVARQLALAAAPMPERYLGIDLHAGMIRWVSENLEPELPNFSFAHHDVHNPGLNPDPALPRTAPLPVGDGEVTLMVAVSVFTHLLQDQVEYYLDEVARVLAAHGVLQSTFFLFDKAYFPMMQGFQAALYINDNDPTNAVILDRAWLLEQLDRRGLRVRAATAPEIRGFQWLVQIERGRGSIELPPDEAPLGHRPPPVSETPAHLVGDDGPPDG